MILGVYFRKCNEKGGFEVNLRQRRQLEYYRKFQEIGVIIFTKLQCNIV
jgi:hypothetical protein